MSKVVSELQWSSAALDGDSGCLDLINHILVMRDDPRIFCVPVRPVQADFYDSLQLDKLYPDHFEQDLAEKNAGQ
jgi:hypothetical protein